MNPAYSILYWIDRAATIFNQSKTHTGVSYFYSKKYFVEGYFDVTNSLVHSY